MDNFWICVAVFAAFVIAGTVLLPLFLPTDKTAPADDGKLNRIISPQKLQRLKLLAATTSILVAALVSLLLELSVTAMVIAAAVLPAIALRLIKIAVDKKKRQRNERFEMEMLDFTILVKNLLRSGFALPAAISMAIQNTDGPVNEEFSAVLREYQLGVDLGTAIRSVADRIESENLLLFTSAVNVSIKTGGSAADVLERIIQTISRRNEVRNKLKTLTAQSEFEAMAISLSPLAALIILYLVDPVLMLPMFESKIGWAVMGGIAIWEYLGFAVIKKVISVRI